jgi:hypothetical protein
LHFQYILKIPIIPGEAYLGVEKVVATALMLDVYELCSGSCPELKAAHGHKPVASGQHQFIHL